MDRPPLHETSPQPRELNPLDKTYTRVMLALDFKHGFTGSHQILEASEFDLPDDTATFLRALDDYAQERPVRVGEGGANYRTMLYLSYLEGRDTEFVKEGSLIDRNIIEDPNIITLSNEELLELNDGTTQYLIARMIWDDTLLVSPALIEKEYKLRVAAQAINDWHQAREVGEQWRPRVDETIARQAEAYRRFAQTGVKDSEFEMWQPEDYCFAKAYEYTNAKDAEDMWPRLRHHESDRIEAMELAIQQAVNSKEKELITVNDHRVVQAIAMRYGLSRERFKHPDCVTKSWPRFWEFIEEVRNEQSKRGWTPQ